MLLAKFAKKTVSFLLDCSFFIQSIDVVSSSFVRMKNPSTARAYHIAMRQSRSLGNWNYRGVLRVERLGETRS